MVIDHAAIAIFEFEIGSNIVSAFHPCSSAAKPLFPYLDQQALFEDGIDVSGDAFDAASGVDDGEAVAGIG